MKRGDFVVMPFIDRDLLYRDPQQYFSYIMELSFIGGGSQSTGQLPVHSVTITANIVSSNPAHGELYSIDDIVCQ
jgi:hypothetical protein